MSAVEITTVWESRLALACELLSCAHANPQATARIVIRTQTPGRMRFILDSAFPKFDLFHRLLDRLLTDVTAKRGYLRSVGRGKTGSPETSCTQGCTTCILSRNTTSFRSRTIWSLSNAFTSTFKELEPIPQFKATAQLGEFLAASPPLIRIRFACASTVLSVNFLLLP